MDAVGLFLSGLSRKNFARVLIMAFADEPPAILRGILKLAFKRFGHEAPEDWFAFASDGEWSDRDFPDVSVPIIYELDLDRMTPRKRSAILRGSTAL